ncbi:hypothetical protein J6590_015156 [Homalodisca vitripennis]|nr:hypothetical protein J6590_015156 [Homalodisca vitripennis]
MLQESLFPQQNILATFIYKLLTDENQQYGLCSGGEDSWYGVNKAKAEGQTYSHKDGKPEEKEGSWRKRIKRITWTLFIPVSPPPPCSLISGNK